MGSVDVYGPRLTGSPATEDAKTWTLAKLLEFGLSDVHEERFRFGRGWSLERFHAHMVEPQVMPLIGLSQVVDDEHERNGRRGGRSRTHRIIRRSGAVSGAPSRGKIVLPQPARAVDMLEGDVVLRMDKTVAR